MKRVITFTNLFPSQLRPQHGTFVYERMRQVLARLGWDWQVICPVAKVPWFLCRDEDRLRRRLPKEEDFIGGRLHHVQYRHLPGVSLARQARTMAKAARPLLQELSRGHEVLVDAHYSYPDGVAAARLAEELGLPFVVTARGSDVNVLGAMPAVAGQLAILAQARARLAVSADLAGRFAAQLGGAQVEVVRNGVDLDFFQPGDEVAARLALGLPQEVPLILGVGRLVAGKGFHTLLQVLPALRAADPRLAAAEVVLIGDGPQRTDLMQMSVGGGLRLLGNQPREVVRQAMQAADLLALPSAAEGWPNVVTEALASGLPVVAHGVGGIPEILHGAPGAQVVQAGDVEGLVAGLVAALTQAPDRMQIRSFATRYSWEPSIDALVELFSACLP